MSAATLSARVAVKTIEAQDIVSVELVAAGADPLPAFAAGAHIDINLPNGVTRQYSLCNDPRESHRYLLCVLRDPASRGGSAAVHDLLQVGDTVQISAPKNHFALANQPGHSLLLAGGIGITPILCMAERLEVAGASFELHYCSRAPERTAFRQRIAASTFVTKTAFHFDSGKADQRLDLEALFATMASNTHLYVCGPGGFIDAVLNAARARNMPEAQLHYEFFAGTAAPLAADTQAFQVRLASSGRVVDVAAGLTVTQALAAVGVDVPMSCEQGVCGTCLTRVLQGLPDHKDLYLTPEEQARNDQFLPCCSRSLTPLLVLDL